MFSRLFGTPKARIVSAVIFLALAMVGGGVIGFLEGRAEALGQGSPLDGTNALWMIGGVAIVLAIVSFAYGAYWMKSIDEAAQEAHKWSWYWGGSAGLAVGMVGFLLSMSPATASWTIPTLQGRTDPMAYATTGSLALMAVLIIGYGIAWAWWWFSRR